MDRETTICSLCRIIIFTAMFITYLFLANLVIDADYIMGMLIYASLPLILIWEFESIITFCFGQRDDFFEKMMEEKR